MKEFNDQLENNKQSFINEFNDDLKYIDIRELYKRNFQQIEQVIRKFGHNLAIEEISIIQQNLSPLIMENRLLLIQINKAIAQQDLLLDDIK